MDFLKIQFVAKYQKMKKRPFGRKKVRKFFKFQKKTKNDKFLQSHSVEKCKRGPFRLFQHSFSCKTPKKIEKGPFEVFKKFQKKSHKAEKVAGKVS